MSTPTHALIESPAITRELQGKEADALLAHHPLYRIVRAPTRQIYEHEIPAGTPVVRCLIVDTQAGGLDVERTPLLEVAVLLATIGRQNGRVYHAGRPCVMRNDPGMSVPEIVVRRTGLTDRLVRGQKLCPRSIRAMLTHADVVIAFNAAFDRPLLERYVPEFATVPWLCAASEIDWLAHGFSECSLELLCLRHANLYLPMRRSLTHVDATLELITTPWPDGQTPIVSLFNTAKQSRVVVWAPNPRFETNGALRDRQYRFYQSSSLGRGWYTYVPPSEFRGELRWLAQTVYGGKLPSNVRVVPVSARLRHATLARILVEGAVQCLQRLRPSPADATGRNDAVEAIDTSPAAPAA